MWKVLVTVAVAGGLGGLLNAMLSGAGFTLPSVVDLPGSRAVLPGFIGNLLVGAAAAVISFGLYGPAAVRVLISTGPPDGTAAGVSLTLAGFVGAILVGFSGGRWLTTEADKQLSQAAKAVTAASAERIVAQLGPTAPKVFKGTQAQAAGGAQSALELLRAVESGSPREAYEKALELKKLVEGPAND